MRNLEIILQRVHKNILTQPAYTYSKAAVETKEKCVKSI